MAKQEKGVAAGLPPASNRTTTKEVKTRLGNSKQKHRLEDAHPKLAGMEPKSGMTIMGVFRLLHIRG
ncbi:hypothetical protein [Undibacterium sp.]|uniref:hypothetical protein n=1 Tax=Undibacterium sp. TaxID=1914977 RepID=UPI0025EBDB1A|nr:hypothetical protein [Undibacterium sp.]